jgi:hypothetical protein
MQTKLNRAVVALLVSSGFCMRAAERQPALLSVCELIEHRNEYNGKIVAVRAMLEGTDEGMWLRAFNDCKYKLITRGVTWPNAISLEYPKNNSKNQADHADFQVDWQVIHTVGLAIPPGFDPKTEVIIKTYVGLFQTYADLESRVSPAVPNALRLGFGHLGTAPARILLKTIKDVAAVRVSPDPK